MSKKNFVEPVLSCSKLPAFCLCPLVFGYIFAVAQAEDGTSKRQNDFTVLPGQRIVLNGDSIVKGYGFGNYTNASPLRTLYGIANILLKDNLPYAPAMKPMPVIWEGLNSD